MTYKHVAIISTACLILGLALGRYGTPAKVVEHTNVVHDTAIVKNDHTVTTVVETKKSDGTDVIVTDTHNDVTTDTTKHSDATSDKVSEYSRDTFTINALVLTTPLSGNHDLAYGAQISYKLLGPISVSALAATNGLVGVGVGLSF